MSRLSRPIVIAAANPKGGAGKSTMILHLGDHYVRRGLSVAAIDADPQQSLFRWICDPLAPSSLRSISAARSTVADEIVDIVEQAKARCDIVLVDSPGVYATVVGAAIMLSDLILVPTRPSHDDVDGCKRAIGQVRQVQRIRADAGEPPLAFAAVLVAFNARALLHRRIESDLRVEVPVMSTTLPNWVAYAEANYFRTSAFHLPGGAAAAQVIERLADEVLVRARAGGAP